MEERRLSRRAVASWVCICSAWSSGRAIAADAAFDIAALPEIVVTAQKTAQTLEQVPLSVTTLDGELAEQSGAIGFPDLQNYAANVVLSLTPTTSDFYVRGFGTPSTNAGFEPSVGTVVDGVFYGRSTFLSAFFFDIDRMEVLRGPQGALFGKNSTAGLFNLTTRAPEAAMGARTELFYAEGNNYAVRPVIDLPVGAAFSARIAGSYSDAEGTLFNTALDRHEVGVEQNSTRLRVRFAPVERWSLDLGAFHSDLAHNNNLFQLSHASEAMVSYVREYDAEAEADANNFRNSANVEARGEAEYDGVHATLDIDIADLTEMDELRVTSVSAWARQNTLSRDLDADFTGAPVIRDSLVGASPFTQRSQELRIAGRNADLFGWGHGVDFVAGLYWYESSLRANDLFELEDLGAALGYLLAAQAGQQGGSAGGLGGLAVRLGTPLGTLINLIEPLLTPAIGERQAAYVSLRQRTQNYAAFGQVEHFFLPHWAVLAGMRVGIEDKSGRATSAPEGQLIGLITRDSEGNPTVVAHDTPLSREESEFSPKAGLKWAPSKQTSAYLTWSRGYKSGGFNALPLNDYNLQFEPERASSWELGAKSRLLQGSLRVSAAIFDTDFEDLQVSTFRGASFVILNAAAARSRGIELDFNWLTPLPGAALYGSAGYTDAYYTHYPNAPAPADAEESSQDLSGKRLAIAPRWTAALVPSFTTYLPWTRMNAAFAVDLLYRSDRYLDVDLDPRTYQPATTEINARMSIAAQTGQWMLNFAARNLTEEVVLEQVLDQPLAAGNFAAIRGDRGREFSANLILSF